VTDDPEIKRLQDSLKDTIAKIGGTAFITCTCASCAFIASGRTVDVVADAIAEHRAYAHPRVS
jgi:hypothetical protein